MANDRHRIAEEEDVLFVVCVVVDCRVVDLLVYHILVPGTKVDYTSYLWRVGSSSSVWSVDSCVYTEHSRLWSENRHFPVGQVSKKRFL